MDTITPRALGDVIATALRDAVAFHGDLGLADGTWTQRVMASLKKCKKNPSDPGTALFAERLHNRDLYLATCCAERLDAAWQRFEALYQKYVEELVRYLSRTSLQALDVGEGLLFDLFLPDRSGHSRIASYDGRSSLATWLHVIVTHRMANERARKWSAVERPGNMPEIADANSTGELEAEMRSARYSRAVDESLKRAVRRLNARDSRLLIWRYQRGLLLEEIGRFLSVHPSTVYRQLERLQVRLRNDVITSLTAFGFRDAAIEECLTDMLENRAGSVSVLGLIADRLPRDSEARAAPLDAKLA
jgi:RNA polymerase sigma-70 factor